MLSKKLTKFGLNEKEAQVYLAMLELGETNIERISRKSKVKRSTVYEVIESLMQKGLIGITTKKTKKLYYAEGPHKFEEDLADKQSEIKKLMPELLSITNLIDKKPRILYFEGEEGIKEIYKDTLKFPNQEILAWITDQLVNYFDESWFVDYYVSKRVKNKIWVRAIGMETEITKKYQAMDQTHLRKMRLLEEGNLPFSVEINLYGKNRVFMVSHKEMIGMIIESETIHETLKSMFEIMWCNLAR